MRISIESGMEGKYRGSWAYIAITYDDIVILSGWRGIKTTKVHKSLIEETRPLKKREPNANS